MKKYIFMISILIILSTIVFIDIHKVRTYYKVIESKENTIKITLTSNYIKANKVFHLIQNNQDILSIQKIIKKNQIKDYVINIPKSMISSGNHKVGLEDPFRAGNLYQIIKFNNKSLCMDFSLIDKNTFITVVSNDYEKSNHILKELQNKNIEEGKKYIQNEKVTVLWYQKNSLEKIDHLNIVL